MQTAIILGFLSVDSDVNIILTKSNKLYVWLTTYLKKSSHNLRLHTYIQKITTPRGYHYKIRMKFQKKTTKYINTVRDIWIYLEVGLRSSQVVMEYSVVPRPNALLACSVKLWLALLFERREFCREF